MCLDLLGHLRQRPWVWTDYRMMEYITRAVPDVLWRLYQIAAFTLAHASAHYTGAMMRTEQAEETALSGETEQAEKTALSEETEQAEETALSVDQHFRGYSG